MDPHREIRKLPSEPDRSGPLFWTIALVIVLFWLVTASHMWG
jgi:hypothetical protein